MAMAAPLAAEGMAAGGAAGAGEVAAGGGAGGGAPLRTPRAGGSAMALDGKNRPPKAKPAAKPSPKQDHAPEEQKPEEASEDAQENRRGRGLPNPGGVVRDGSWIVLGFLGWVWVALPFIKHGPGGVRDVLAAKFINRTPGGSS